MPLAIDLDGLADLFSDLQVPWTIMAGMLALLVVLFVAAQLLAPGGRRIQKRAGRQGS